MTGTVSFRSDQAAQIVSMKLTDISDAASRVRIQTITGKRNNSPQEQPTNQALYAQAMATCSSLKGGVDNATQAVAYLNVAGSAMGSSIAQLIQAQGFCASAINSASSQSALATLQTSLTGILGGNAGSFMSAINQTKWMGTPVLAGGTVTGPLPLAPVTAVVTAVTNLVAPAATTFAPALIAPTGCLGIFNGTVSGATVTQNATTPANIDIKINVGTEVYTGANLVPAITAWWRLTGTNGSVITLISGTAVQTANTYQAQLRTSLGLNPDNSQGPLPAVFVTGTSIAQPVSYTITTTSQAPTGTYGVGVIGTGALGATPWFITISNGTAGGSVAVPAAANGTVSFFGGSITITTPVVIVAAVPNYEFTLSNASTLKFQTGATASDTLNGTLPRVDLISLGLADQTGVLNLTLLDPVSAANASTKIGNAINTMSATNASIGTFQAQASAAASSSNTLLANTSDAATVYDSVDAAAVIAATVGLSIQAANAAGALAPSFSTQMQLKNQLAMANQMASQG